MKAKDLIEKLKEFPEDMEVCIFDWRQNLNDDWGDGSGTGIHSDFEVGIAQELSEDEKEFYKERNGIDYKPWIAMSFENGDYDIEGRCMREE